MPDVQLRTAAPHQMPGEGVVHMRALGTTVTLAVDRPDRISSAQAILVEELDAIDRTCSRFRADSEIWALYASPGESVRVSALLFEAIATACDVAARTGGAVDPTVGGAIEQLGYDRDFDEARSITTPLSTLPRPAPGWWRVELDASRRTVRVPAGLRLDLGASAKALTADRAAANIESDTGSGVLVSIGGDVSVAGPTPPGGWAVGISVDSSTALEAVGHVVSLSSGGLASSSTAVRTWRRGGRRLHHIIDPLTGDSASEHWKLVSVAAATCVDANAASTAAIVWGSRAVGELEALELPARLVRQDGTVVTTGGWPSGALS
ncbi:MAG TPA: FAD:protein FMN transferase [Acidimicrobiales bacterium]|nr:FAD:protein FMN transferase [Acidimicrobiales bacterium]